MQLKLYCIQDEIFSYLIKTHGQSIQSHIDENLYVLCNPNIIDREQKWFYLCCNTSEKRYKVAIISILDIPRTVIYVSESMKYNIVKQFNTENSNESLYFLVPINEHVTSFATEVKVSLIHNPYNYNEDLLNDALQSYFTTPKYLRENDIIKVDFKSYLPEFKYYIVDSNLDILYFKVNKVNTENKINGKNGNFAVYGKTTVIQESNVNSYLPRKCFCNVSFDAIKNTSNYWPPIMRETLQNLQSCIDPFLQKDIFIDVNPVFLVNGPVGSGKSRLVKATAESLGFHLLEADVSEVQSLTSAQTEAKLKIILHESETCVPCIIMLQNIQIFGINSEGQKDERVLSALTTELKKLFNKKRNYPIIIIATSSESEIPIDSERTFVETISIDRLELEQRCQVLIWLMRTKGLKYDVDLQKIAKLCSDFVLADLEALVLHAVKNCFKRRNHLQNVNEMMISNDDFVHACEHMQSVFSDQLGVPRVPTVHWEDIGGLVDLKKEIMRRIEMPLLNIPGMRRSGLLLYGPPGTGKTLLAKAVATECQLHFLSVKGPELLNMYVGQSERNVRQIFERARAAAPCIIFFDELDSLAPNRGQSGDSGGVMDRVVSQLLAEMDGLESTGSIFIIAATNRPDLIDPALLRPGRFDKMLYVGLYADLDSQMSVLKALTRQFRMEENGDELKKLVEKLPANLTGADLYSVCSNAWLRAVKRILIDKSLGREKVRGEDVIVKLDDFLYATKELVPSVSKEEMLRYERLGQELSSR
ncbi:peroxisomal ATPase PEX6 isoform X2 [Phymastichus coffea]|nr:peroxisomal ATPase PEX6 isoform X2 [Phymastichus coffea]